MTAHEIVAFLIAISALISGWGLGILYADRRARVRGKHSPVQRLRSGSVTGEGPSSTGGSQDYTLRPSPTSVLFKDVDGNVKMRRPDGTVRSVGKLPASWLEVWDR